MQPQRVLMACYIADIQKECWTTILLKVLKDTLKRVVDQMYKDMKKYYNIIFFIATKLSEMKRVSE